jgi:hypothetical protein
MRRLETWQVVVFGTLGVYLALGVATHTIRPYHWFMLCIIPLALLAREGTRTFLFEWAPVIGFWLIYDRLRLIQHLLLPRVAVAWPYDVEKLMFGWLGNGDVPAHAWRHFLAVQSSNPAWGAISVAAQLVYFSHLVVFPALLLVLWIRGRTRRQERQIFWQHLRAFTVLHILGIVTYIAMPVAPPWWVSIHGITQPDPQLLAATNIQLAMDGVIIQRLIGNASQWFAAVPSLHGAYPVLLYILWRNSGVRRVPLMIAFYGLAMFAATVALNQHYIIDLLAGAAVAVIAQSLASLPSLSSLSSQTR